MRSHTPARPPARLTAQARRSTSGYGPAAVTFRCNVIPIGDDNRSRTTPWVTYAIIVLNLVAFLGMLGLSTTIPTSQRAQLRDFQDQTATVCYGFRTLPTEVDRFVCRWGFQPKEFFDNLKGKSTAVQSNRMEVLLSIVTTMFLHAGWLHILGNLLFLWVFGNNVEDRLGRPLFLAFYLLSGVVAALVHGLVDPGSVVPVVGASGAVAGVLGAYLVCFPKATVRVVIPFFFLFLIPIPVPAVVMIGLWFVQNLLAGLATVNAAATPDSGTAFFAHIGGFLFGVLVGLLLASRPRRRPPPAWH